MVLEEITGNFAKSFSVVQGYGVYTVMFLVSVAVCLGIMYYVMNKRSYNFHVVILRPRQNTGAFDFEAGYLGKHVLNRNKELRFKIYSAKRHKIQYNEEPIDQQYWIKRMFGGRYTNMVILAPNSEGWLQPIKMTIEGLHNLNATVTNADLTYYMSELSLMDQYFNDKGFFEKYGMFIIVLMMIVNTCVLLYAVYKLGGVAEAFKSTADAFNNAAQVLVQNATTETNTGSNIIKLPGVN